MNRQAKAFAPLDASMDATAALQQHRYQRALGHLREANALIEQLIADSAHERRPGVRPR